MNLNAATAMVGLFRDHRRMRWLEHCERHVHRDRRLGSFRAFRDAGLEILDADGPWRATNLGLWAEVCLEEKDER